MDNIVQIMKSIPAYIGSSGRIDGDIRTAEDALGTGFAPDYKQYLKEIGLACFNGHEFTGLTDNNRLSVVSVTKQERAANAVIPSSWYVIEQANIDGIVIWQAPTGEIYQTAPGSPAKIIYNSLTEFISDIGK